MKKYLLFFYFLNSFCNTGEPEIQEIEDQPVFIKNETRGSFRVYYLGKNGKVQVQKHGSLGRLEFLIIRAIPNTEITFDPDEYPYQRLPQQNILVPKKNKQIQVAPQNKGLFTLEFIAKEKPSGDFQRGIRK